MTDTEILLHAKSYIDKLANGINPLTDKQVPETDTINNVRISRCLFFVSNVLEQVIMEKPKQRKRRTDKMPFCISADKLSKYVYSDTPVSLSDIVKQLNNLIDLDEYNRIKRSQITGWLIETGLLTIRIHNGKAFKTPTPIGNEAGISVERIATDGHEYDVVLYDTDAQHYIIDNLEEIIDHSRRNSSKCENEGKTWTDAQDERLIEMFQDKLPVSKIAFILGRTEAGIRAHMVELGLIRHRSDAK